MSLIAKIGGYWRAFAELAACTMACRCFLTSPFARVEPARQISVGTEPSFLYVMLKTHTPVLFSVVPLVTAKGSFAPPSRFPHLA